MKKTIVIFAIFALACITKIQAQAPVFNIVTPNSVAVQKSDKFELTIDLTAGYTNPYDYSDIDVQCAFVSPSGIKDTVDGFYEQDYVLDTSTGNISSAATSHFKVRYAPKETGIYTYMVSCTNKSGYTSQAPQTFTCTASSSHGFIRKNNTNYFGFDDNTQYNPVGENMCWQDANVYNDYTKWIPKLTASGGNYIRIWMSDWAFAYEWKDVYNQGLYHGLKNYNQYNAFNLDWLLDYCSRQNVYIMLCLNHHGQVSTTVDAEWNNNPYNTANGGPCANTWDFFSNTTAKDDYKNRMRYLIARCGYSKNILCWELFNEVGFTDNYSIHAGDVDAWHNEMSMYLKTIDVNKHLITTSFGDASYRPATWTYPDIDFTQIHTYSSTPNLESTLVAGDTSYLSVYKKPVLNGEFGLGPSGVTLSADDPNGVHIHNAIWATALGGAAGTAMTWWWNDYIDPQNLYYHYNPLSSFLNEINLKDGNYKPAVAYTTGGNVETQTTISPGAGFVKAPASEFTIDASGNITPDASQLSQYIFGSTYNTQYSNPPTFTVTYPVGGQFKIAVSDVASSSAVVGVAVDNVTQVNQNAQKNTIYIIDIPAGTHTISIGNPGVDWFRVSNYIFTNIGSSLSAYNSKSVDSTKAAGWILNTQYNWQYLKNTGNIAPPAVSGATLTITGMRNGEYTVQFYSCSTGLITGNSSGTVTGNTLAVALPTIAWDVAYTVTNNAVLPVKISSFTGQIKNSKNVLTIDIANAINVKNIMLERSADGTSFTTLANLSNSWNTVNGTHAYTDVSPLTGSNYYRLVVQDNDGKISVSNIVLLVSTGKPFSIYPNPAKNYFYVSGNSGSYTIKVTDAAGRILLANKTTIASPGGTSKIALPQIAAGLYHVTVIDRTGKATATFTLMKQ